MKSSHLLTRFRAAFALAIGVALLAPQSLAGAAVPGAIGQPYAIARQAGGSAQRTAENRVVYLPFVLHNASPSLPPGIYGLVTYQGAPAPGIPLGLRFNNGSGWSTLATVTTGSDGRYRFTGVPSLGSGQLYGVHFGLNSTDPRYVAHWYGPDIPIYTAGSDVAGGDFDIANVKLLSPAPGATLSLPITFSWERRGLLGDTYRWMMYNPADPSWSSTSGDLGDVGSFVLTALPPGAAYGTEYRWLVLIYNGPNSLGSSYYYRRITLTGGLSQEFAPALRSVRVRDWAAPEGYDVLPAAAER